MFCNLNLKPGVRVEFKQNKRDKMGSHGTVVKEYPFFIVIDLGKYKVSANKASLICGDERLERI
ncbi:MULTISPECIES: hypothetical protein [Clostridium]|uniref:KOW motif-containing protein n=1 Tax=Clostridium frigoriphilum TaxID=443253 RepID=A0ABU7URB0_9CLOT|nr:hypothetical protein [Clostridium sp. DSM 17811]MBU3100693.1 hypothetical protein [Clostridium sp. DSM 17811]